ncbi:MAG TPA: hypothetical protein VFV95_13945 [Vicinamibacterales bacterium]|nr:hypothetical protein [Vicinamibacterales bacterium]
MRIRKSILAACGAALIVLATTAGGHAASSRTYLTFDKAVALPGVTLAGGTYLFERMGTGNDLVRVSSQDGARVYLTAFTHEIARPAGSNADLTILLGEASAGMPVPIRAWFPEHADAGREFIYR